MRHREFDPEQNRWTHCLQEAYVFEGKLSNKAKSYTDVGDQIKAGR
jgi:hypothetical protein